MENEQLEAMQPYEPLTQEEADQMLTAIAKCTGVTISATIIGKQSPEAWVNILGRPLGDAREQLQECRRRMRERLQELGIEEGSEAAKLLGA